MTKINDTTQKIEKAKEHMRKIDEDLEIAIKMWSIFRATISRAEKERSPLYEAIGVDYAGYAFKDISQVCFEHAILAISKIVDSNGQSVHMCKFEKWLRYNRKTLLVYRGGYQVKKSQRDIDEQGIEKALDKEIEEINSQILSLQNSKIKSEIVDFRNKYLAHTDKGGTSTNGFVPSELEVFLKDLGRLFDNCRNLMWNGKIDKNEKIQFFRYGQRLNLYTGFADDLFDTLELGLQHKEKR